MQVFNTMTAEGKKRYRAWRDCSIAVALFSMMQGAYATQLSNFAAGWESEAAAIAPVILLIISAIGVVTAGIATISAVMAKKNQQPLQWQLWGLLGGALAVVVPTFILATSGSLTSGEGDAAGAMSRLNIGY